MLECTTLVEGNQPSGWPETVQDEEQTGVIRSKMPVSAKSGVIFSRL